MSAPSDGARADARKRLAAEVQELSDREVQSAEESLTDVLRGLSGEIAQMLGIDPTNPLDIAASILASDWLAGVIADAKAEAWDERDRARATCPDPHPEDCAGWEDCWCASYPNPYRTESIS